MIATATENAEKGDWSKMLYSPPAFGDRFDVTRLKTTRGRLDYNREIASTTETLDKLKFSQFQDPLSVLPPELWLHCLAEVVDNNSINLLPLLLVCNKWRDLLISAAPLWTNIYIRDNPEYADCTHTAIRLSQKLPLSVTIEIPLPPSAFPHPIWWEAPRIRDLTFKRSPRLVRSASTTDVGAMDEFYDTIFELLTPLGTLPILEFLTILHHFDYYSLSMTKVGFPNTPMLRGIKFWCLPVNTLAHLSLDQLNYLSSSSPLPELYPVMPRLRRLKRLILTQAGDCQDDSPIIPLVDVATLPAITALEFYQSSPQSMSPFLEVANSTITELQIKVSWAEFGKLAPKFGNLPLLRHLHIILRAPKNDIKGFELLLPPLKQVRKFEIEQQPYETETPPTVSDVAIGSMLDACRASVTDLDSFLLVLHDTVPTSNLLHCINSLHKLRKFEFKGKLRQESHPLIITKDTLEEIILSNETLLLHLYAPNALEIYVATANEKEAQTHLPDNFRLDAPKLRTLSLHAEHARIIQSGGYPDLRHLTWIDPTNGCAFIAKSFNSLNKISFDSSSPRKECNDFCELIMRYPASCPALETIEMRAYPEWDLLFYMLVRRNIDRPKSLTAISTLKLPGYPGVSLLVPMAELLGGRFPKAMPSISELSLIAVDAPYFEPDVLGCEDCIDCRMTCNAPLERRQEPGEDKSDVATITNSRVPKPVPDLGNPPSTSESGSGPGNASTSSEEQGLRGSDPPLPKDLEEWFDAWGVRRLTWFNKWTNWDRKNRRKGACDRHDYCDLVSITGDLLESSLYKSTIIERNQNGQYTVDKPGIPLFSTGCGLDDDVSELP